MKKNTQEGFVIRIIIIIVALVALKYAFHIDVIAWLKTPQAQNIIQPIWSGIKNFYFFVDEWFRNHF